MRALGAQLDNVVELAMGISVLVKFLAVLGVHSTHALSILYSCR